MVVHSCVPKQIFGDSRPDDIFPYFGERSVQYAPFGAGDRLTVSHSEVETPTTQATASSSVVIV